MLLSHKDFSLDMASASKNLFMSHVTTDRGDGIETILSQVNGLNLLKGPPPHPFNIFNLPFHCVLCHLRVEKSLMKASPLHLSNVWCFSESKLSGWKVPVSITTSQRLAPSTVRLALQGKLHSASAARDPDYFAQWRLKADLSRRCEWWAGGGKRGPGMSDYPNKPVAGEICPSCFWNETFGCLSISSFLSFIFLPFRMSLSPLNVFLNWFYS